MTQRRILVISGVLAALVALYAAAGFLLAPRLAGSRLEALAQDRLGEPLRIERLRINPFTFTVKASGVQLGQQPVVAARELTLDLNPFSSGFGRGWVLADLGLDGLRVAVEADKNGQLNLARLAQRWQQTAQPDGGGSTGIVIRHLAVNDGEVSYRDLRENDNADAKMVALNIELSDLSTLPGHDGRYSLGARLAAGGSMKWEGTLALAPLGSQGRLAFEGVQLAGLMPVLRGALEAKLSGALDASGQYRLASSSQGADFDLTGVSIKGSTLELQPSKGERLLALRSLEVRDASVSLAKREVVVPVLQLADGEVHASNSSSGVIDWSALSRREAAPAPKASEPWHVDIKSARLADVAVHYRDFDRPTPLAVDASSLEASAALDLAVGGPAAKFKANNLSGQVKELSLSPAQGDTPKIQITGLRISDAGIDVAGHALAAKQITAGGGSLPVERDRSGTFALATLFQGKPAATGDAPWTYSVDEVRLDSLQVPLSDRSFTPPIAYQLDGLSLHATHVASGSREPIAFEASARVREGGTLAARGSAAPDGSRADARITLQRFALVGLQPLVAKSADVTLASGRGSAQASVAWRNAAGKGSLTATGTAALEDVLLKETKDGDPVISWKRLSAGDLRLTLGPDALSIGLLTLEGADARVAVSRERDLNLAQLIKSSGSDEKSSPFAVNVAELRIRGGAVDFSDESLVLPFSTRVTSVDGSIVGLSNAPGRRAALELEGEIGESGAAHAKGSLETMAPTHFTDIEVSFENVTMPPLSPYSATFLGRKIASGDLWLKLDYKIADRKLLGDNSITARNLTLGERVDAPGALDLPLDLALALLTDSEGRITVGVPISGEIGDPQFAVGPAIRAALGNLIRRIVTAPFRALASLFGGREDAELGEIGFDPGTAGVPPAERSKLDALAKALSDRPQLRLVVHAPYDTERDAEALRETLARSDVAQALGRPVAPGETPVPIAFDDPATQRALEDLLEKREPGALKKLTAESKNRDADFYRGVFARLAKSEPLPPDAEQGLAARRAQAVIAYLTGHGVDAKRMQPGGIQHERSAEGRVNARLALEAAPPG